MPVRDDSMREQITQVGGTSLRVAIRPGTGTGPPLLLCNGIGMRLEAWRPFVDALDPAIEVITFDAPGVGGSQLPNRPYRFTTLALLLREMLHNLGHQQADVLGISWGGELLSQPASPGDTQHVGLLVAEIMQHLAQKQGQGGETVRQIG